MTFLWIGILVLIAAFVLLHMLRDVNKCSCRKWGWGDPMVCQGRLIYFCTGCWRFLRFCQGAADDMPKHCDDCWAAAHKENE